MSLPASTRQVLVDVALERARQDEKFPGQRNSDGTGPRSRARAWLPPTRTVRAHVDDAARDGTLGDAAVLVEEVCEALDEVHPAKLRAELVQVSAVAVRWVERLDADAASRGQSLVEERAVDAGASLFELGDAEDHVEALRRTNRVLEEQLLAARMAGHNLAATIQAGASLDSSAGRARMAPCLTWGTWLQEHGHLWRDLGHPRTVAHVALRVRDASAELAAALDELALELAKARRANVDGAELKRSLELLEQPRRAP